MFQLRKKKYSAQSSLQDLIEGCQKGHSVAQSALYEQFASRMMGVCIRYCKTREEAEDTFQEAFVKVFEKIGTYRGGKFDSWMIRIFINTAITNYHKARKHYDNQDIHFIPEPSVNQEDALQKLSNEELQNIIQQLPEGYRMVFNLYVVEGYKHNEIAQMLQISVGTSKSQLHKARAMLASWLEKYQITAYVK